MHKWENDTWSQRVTIPVHGKRILKLRTLKSILEQAEINVEDIL